MVPYSEYKCKDALTEQILKEITEGIVNGCPKEYLEKVVLYGSYSRNQQTEDSDIDVIVFISADVFKERKLYRKSMDWVGDVCNKYFKMIPLAVVRVEEFEMYKDIKFYYKEIIKDGVILYERNEINSI